MADYYERLTLDGVLLALEGAGFALGAVNPNEYHAWKGQIAEAMGCPVVSKTDLADFARSPYRYHYRKEHALREETRAMRRGSLIDTLVLTPELFDAQYALPWQPDEPRKVRVKKDGKPYENGEQDPEQKERWRAAAAEYAERSAGKVAITQAELDEAQVVARRALNHLQELGMQRGVDYDTQVAFFVAVD